MLSKLNAQHPTRIEKDRLIKILLNGKEFNYLGKSILDNGWHRHFKQNIFIN
jgi:hypothetical protein